MSFSRSRQSQIPDPIPNFYHHHFRFNSSFAPSTSQFPAATNTSALLPYSQKQNRDRTFSDLDAISLAPPPKRRRPDPSSRFDEQSDDSRRRRRVDAEESQASVAATADYMSRAEIERCSPSRKDGIDSKMEMRLRHSYCSYLQCLGTKLRLPQLTIGTAMVLCHRFFVRRSHASHDRFLIATAALFLATKSEESPCQLNAVLRASCELCQNFGFFPYMVYGHDWFEQYRERVIEAEQLILTTLDFELDVLHPYDLLKSVLSKIGLSQTALMHHALQLVTSGLWSSLWLQYKPHHIAATAVYLAASFINFDLSYYPNIWHEFKTSPSIIHDVRPQLMESWNSFRP